MRGQLVLMSVCVALVGTPGGDEIEKLIDALVNTSEPGLGYTGSQSGTEFLPLEDSRNPGALLLGGAPPVRSETLLNLVKRGAAAVPHLVAHLGDVRQTGIKIRNPISRFEGVTLEREYDYNRRTTSSPPDEVTFPGEPTALRFETIEEHTITVGDLCFVALGQIVNRNFSAARYQPSGIVIVNSPTRLPAFRSIIEKEWSGLTPERHRASLLVDLEQPDHEERRIGAVQRLHYYFPDASDEAVLKHLAKPRYSVFVAEDFVKRREAAHEAPEQWKEQFEVFVSRHGAVYREALFLYLSQRLVQRDSLTRDLLHTLYPERAKELPTDPKALRREQWRLTFDHIVSEAELARFIKALVHKSEGVDEAVHQILLSLDDPHYECRTLNGDRDESDDYLALACAKRLAGKGFDHDIRRYCERRAALSKYHGKELQVLLENLRRD